MSYLIDTDIIIYSLKNNGKVIAKFQTNRLAPKSLSVVTYGELVYGARKSKNVETNLAKIHRLIELFPVINITPSIMDTFGALKASLAKTSMILDDMDLLIASTALTHNLVLVTNNEKHFKRVNGLEIENWAT